MKTTWLCPRLSVYLFCAAAIMGCTENHAVSSTPPSAAVTAPAAALGEAFAAVAASVSPSIVSVYSEKIVKMEGDAFPFGDDFFRFFFGERNGRSMPKSHPYKVPQQGLGSGIIIDGKGHILTNAHVVGEMDKLKVVLPDKRSFAAKVVEMDTKTDLAIIEITQHVAGDLVAARLGDSSALKVGHLVLAVGAPFGYAQTVTSGIISATGRSNVGVVDYEDFLQTDAPINPGNSGGPLVNMNGEVVGVNTAIATQIGQASGVGFAIPINMVKTIMPRLLEGKKVIRGQLGVAIQDLDENLAGHFHLKDSKGALVSQVEAGSPADKAGLKVGDVVLRYNGKAVTDTHQLRDAVSGTEPGKKVEIQVLRNGKEMKLTATIAELKTGRKAQVETKKDEGALSSFGIRAETLTPELARRYRAEVEKGVVVMEVDPAGTAGMAGVQEGDVIVEVNHEAVSDMEDVRKAMLKSRDKILLLVKRQGASLYLALEK